MQFEISLAVLGAIVLGGVSVIWVPHKKHPDRTLLNAYPVFLGIVESAFLVTVLGLSLLRRGFHEASGVSGIAVGLYSLL